MAICYSGQTLRQIFRTLPRRPFIPPHTFNRLQELHIYRQFRGQGLQYFQGQRKIPVRITENSVLQSPDINRNMVKSCKVNQNLVNLSGIKKVTQTSKLACSLINCRSINGKSDMLRGPARSKTNHYLFIIFAIYDPRNSMNTCAKNQKFWTISCGDIWKSVF